MNKHNSTPNQALNIKKTKLILVHYFYILNVQVHLPDKPQV